MDGNCQLWPCVTHARTTGRSCPLGRLTTLLLAAFNGSCAVRALGLRDYNITSPLRVCTASIQNSGLRCNGAPAELRDAVQPEGPVPPGGWCAPGQNFCGNDVDLWSEVAERMGLLEDYDYVRVCFGEAGFEHMIDSLADENPLYGKCDVGVSGITASSKREDRGITFSRATHRSSLAILIHAHYRRRGMWAFFEPLHLYVWISMAVTVVVTPLIVFFFEAVFNKSPFYAKDGKLDIVRGLRECMWHSVCHTLSIDVFRVRSFPARIVTVAYAFLVLILTHTYTANLAAFFTAEQISSKIRSITELRGKAVATIEPYVSRLAENHQISASTADAWDYDRMIAKLRAGEYVAVISDDTQLIPRAYADGSCSLHILEETVEPFDLAFAFSRNFPSDAFRDDVSSHLLDMQEDGTLVEVRSKYTPDPPRCLAESTEYNETNQVEMSALWGLWVIMAGAAAASIIAGVTEWAIKRRRQHPGAEEIGARVDELASIFSGARHSVARQRAAAAADAAVCDPDKPTPFLPGPGSPGGPRTQIRQHAQHAAYRHGSGGGRAGYFHDPLRHSTISEHEALPDAAARPANLSMLSMPSMGGQASCEGSGHGARPEATVIALPEPPQADVGADAWAAQQTGAEAAAEGLATGAQGAEFRAELSEVMSMLRMVTDRMNTLQRTQQTHV